MHAEVPSSGAVDAKGLQGQKKLTDNDALRRQHRFVRDEQEDKKAEQVRSPVIIRHVAISSRC